MVIRIWLFARIFHCDTETSTRNYVDHEITFKNISLSCARMLIAQMLTCSHLARVNGVFIHRSLVRILIFVFHNFKPFLCKLFFFCSCRYFRSSLNLVGELKSSATIKCFPSLCKYGGMVALASE